ncbi:MAG: PQQ-dependent sugar dehydrogenase [Eubacteriales bacterium]|nr:PQQ-dependent sugar dehydrogenase [Eubacteriales bacterium]
MNKKWRILPVILVVLIVFWQFGGLDLILARTIFAPDYKPSSTDDAKTEESSKTNTEEQSSNEETTDHSGNSEKILFSTQDLVYEIEIIGEGLEIPWEIAHLPDGRLLVTERSGRVAMLDSGEKYAVHDVEHIGEGGLLGMAVSLDFKESSQLFLYYTYKSGNQIYNRVSRFTLVENVLTDEIYILDEIPGARFHNGGRLKFGPDEKLYITTGDAQDSNLSQDINSLAGKILRINPNGTIPEDNPFEDSPVFAYGLRNPQGLSWHPVSGELFASDHGPNSQDEINLILPGKNYGWPIVTCLEGDSQYEDPVTCYSDFTLAPSGIAFLPWNNLVESPLYVAGLRGNMVMRIDLDDVGGFVRQEELFRDYGRIRAIVYYEGSIYIATNNRDGRGVPGEKDDMIIKITPILE